MRDQYVYLSLIAFNTKYFERYFKYNFVRILYFNSEMALKK